jgi:hypothetical protein
LLHLFFISIVLLRQEKRLKSDDSPLSILRTERIKYADTNKANIKSNKTNLDIIL